MFAQDLRKYLPLIVQGIVSIAFCIYFVFRAIEPLHTFEYVFLVLSILVIITTLYITGHAASSSHDQTQQVLKNIFQTKSLKHSIVTNDDSEKELADNINALLTDIKRILSDANKSTEQLFETGAILSTSSAEIAQASDKQSQLASQTNSAIHNLTVGISHVTQHATNTLSITHETFTLCQEGESHAAAVLQGVSSVNDTFTNIGSLVDSLAKRSEEIAGIINVIGEIADQTNLLALNAAIEAARAGEQGRGFAVVADEVRGLAERTRKATIQVTEMVTSICNETKQVVVQMGAGKDTVDRCVELTEKTSAVLGSILEKAADVEARTNEIASSAEQQNYSSTAIETTINDITEMSNSINKNVHHSNQEMRRLLRMASDMLVSIREYKITHVSELTSIRDCISLVRMNAILAANASTTTEARKPIQDIASLDSKISALWGDYNKSLRVDQKILANQFYDQWKVFKEARAITLKRAEEGDFPAARQNATTNAGPKFQIARQTLENAIAESDNVI